MKITTISKVASLVISSVMIQTAVAGHAVGIGVGVGCGIFDMLFGGDGCHSAPAFGGGARFSFGARPTFGQPVIVRSYYAYDYYPYDYYPGYYADVEPYYNNEGVYYGNPSPDPTVKAVQRDLTKLGYYHGSKRGQRCPGRPAQSRGRDHSRLDRYDASAAFFPLPSLERRS